MKSYLFIQLLLLFFLPLVSNAQIKTSTRLPASNNTQPVTPVATSVIKTTLPVSDMGKMVVSANGFVKMRLKLPFTSEEKDYYVKQKPIEGTPYFQYILDGDIVVGNNLPGTMSHSVNSDRYKWQGDIPLFMHQTVADSSMCLTLNLAITEIHKKTKIRFVAYSGQADYIQIRIGDPGGFVGGVSPMGRRGGMQEIVLSRGVSFGLIVHEMLHSLGIYHEQSRPDRDNYVDIVTENIEADATHNFNIVPGISRGYYDYGSIMHYFFNAFGKDNKTTIRCKSDGTTANCPKNMGQQNGLSANDIMGLNTLYRNISFSNVVASEILPASGSFSEYGGVTWDKQELILPDSISLDDALYLKIMAPATVAYQTNFCTGNKEAVSYNSSTQEIFPEILFKPIEDYPNGKFAKFVINNLPIDNSFISMEVYTNNEVWQAGSKLGAKPAGKNVGLRVWAEDSNPPLKRYIVKAMWFDYGDIPPQIQFKKIERKKIQTDGSDYGNPGVEKKDIKLPAIKTTPVKKNNTIKN
jgi:Astacin (Peptidase family M12A)